jgi:hypothetical protein
MIFLTLLYACEIWSLTLREEHKLIAFENTVLRIFGPKRNKVTGGGDTKRHKKEPRNFYPSLSTIRMIM